MECEILCSDKQQIVDFGILVVALRCHGISAARRHLAACVQWRLYLFIIAPGTQMRKSVKLFEKSLAFGTQYKSAYFYFSW